MEQENSGEQPQNILDTQTTEVEELEGAESLQNVEGSLGKFKDTQSLLKAYNSLQAEFTKKCQSLSELKAKQLPNEPVLPIYEKENWVEKVSGFLQENSQAKPFAKEIAQSILADDELAKKDNALELAWAKVASSKYKEPLALVEDEKFVEDYVLKNEKIKDAVLKMYFDEIKKNAVPKVMSSNTGGFVGQIKTKQAQSLIEAKEMARQFFD